MLIRAASFSASLLVPAQSISVNTPTCPAQVHKWDVSQRGEFWSGNWPHLQLAARPARVDCRGFGSGGSKQARVTRVTRAMFQWSKRPEFKGTKPRVIVITSGKGGVGKTTVTANLGMSLARLEFKVVAIDCDVGLRNLDLLLGMESRVFHTVQDVVNGEARLDQALVRDKRCPNFELLCISKPRSKVDLTFSGKSLLLLVESLREREEGCPHFILLDCPAGIEAGFITAITPANEAIIVTTPDVTCLRDADRVAGLLECDGITNVKLMVNRVRSDLIKAGQMMSVSDIREMLVSWHPLKKTPHWNDDCGATVVTRV